VAELLFARVPGWQSTAVVPEQLPMDGVTETSTPVDGSEAVNTTSDAATGPLFVTVAV
jgi:hypothetical protein